MRENQFQRAAGVEIGRCRRRFSMGTRLPMPKIRGVSVRLVFTAGNVRALILIPQRRFATAQIQRLAKRAARSLRHLHPTPVQNSSKVENSRATRAAPHLSPASENVVPFDAAFWVIRLDEVEGDAREGARFLSRFTKDRTSQKRATRDTMELHHRARWQRDDQDASGFHHRHFPAMD